MKKQTSFVNKIFYRFFLPSTLSSFGLALGGIADALVVGNIIGEAGLAAISFTSPIYMVFNTFDVGLGLGGSIHFTKHLGAGEVKKGLSTFNQVSVFSILCSFLIAVLGNLFLPQLLMVLGASPDQGEVYHMAWTYAQILLTSAPVFFLKYVLYYFVRCDDNQKLASVALVTGNIVDLILNFVFVLGFKMGVAGAVISTVIGSAVMCLLLLPHFFAKWTILRFSFEKPKISLAWQSFRTGFATSSQYIYQFFALAILNNIIVRIGGATGVAVFDIMYNVSYVITSICDGTGMTLQPMVATFFGEKNIPAIKDTLRLSLTRGAVLTFILVAAIFVFAQPVCLLFGLKSAASLALGQSAVRIYCISSVFAFFNVLMCSYYQSIDKERFSYVINLLRSFVLLLLFCFVFSFLGIALFWWAYVATEVLSLLSWCLYNILRKNGFLALNTIDENRVLSYKISDLQTDLSEIVEEVESFCDRWEADFTQSYYVTLAIEEMCSTIMENAFDATDDAYIQITLVSTEENTFTLHLRDNARSFNPFDMKTQRIETAEDDEGMDTIGILLVKKRARDFFYRRYQGFNTLVITV